VGSGPTADMKKQCRRSKLADRLTLQIHVGFK
jgi:hypothetical protein